MKGFQSKISVGLFIAIYFVSLFPLDAQARRTHVWDSAEKISPYITKDLDYSKKDFSQRSGQNELVLKELADIKKKQEKIVDTLDSLGKVEGSNFAPDSSRREPWYITGNISWSMLHDIDFTDTYKSGSTTGTADGDAAGHAIASIAVGRSFGALRIEAELSYRENDVDSAEIESATFFGITAAANEEIDVEAEISAVSAMVSGWYDFNIGSNWFPYIGAGMGISRIYVDISNIASQSVTYNEYASNSNALFPNDVIFAYQVGLGLGYQLTPDISVDLSYRFYSSMEAKFDDGTDKFEIPYRTSNLTLGIMHRF